MSKNKKKQTLSFIGALFLVLLIYILGRVTDGKSITNWKYSDLEQHTDLIMSLDDLDEIMIPMG